MISNEQETGFAICRVLIGLFMIIITLLFLDIERNDILRFIKINIQFIVICLQMWKMRKKK